MGLLVAAPSHYEGLMWMALFFILVSTLPLIYNFFNTSHTYLPIIPMQSSLFQTCAFMIFMFSLYCSASMLPCGRYYYEPEGGYVGNPWVKFSYQYIYLYLGWFIHHLDLIDNYPFRFIQTYTSYSNKLVNKSFFKTKYKLSRYNQLDSLKKTTDIKFKNTNYNLKI